MDLYPRRMTRKLYLLVVPVVFALAACSRGSDDKATPPAPTTSAAVISEPSATPTPKAPSLKAAVKAYSDAFLTGDAKTAYALLSDRCQERSTAEEFGAIVDQAGQMYGSALAFKSFDAEVSGDLARATYTYDVSALDQKSEPWVLEAGAWHEDDC